MLGLVQQTVLVVEDDDGIALPLVRTLDREGYAVERVAEGLPAVERVAAGGVQLVILDLGLPDIDGRETLRMIRGIDDVPIVVATARDDEAGIVDILDQGADDYLVKPFGPAQLDARIRAVLRRARAGGDAGVLVVGDLRLDPATRQAVFRGTPLDLTAREFDRLAYLASRTGAVVSKRELLAQVWRSPYGGTDKTIDVHLSWLRRKLGESASEPRYLHTIRGVGVRLVAPSP